MIASFLPNEVSTTLTESEEYLEDQVAAIASPKQKPASQGIRRGLDKVASHLAETFATAAQAAIEQAFIMGQALSQMKQDFKRSEYQIFLEQPGWTFAKANKYIKLNKTFEGFSLNQLSCISLDTLFTLCGSRYQQLVAKLRETPELTQKLVEQLMKECRPARKLQIPVTGWKRNPSGGGRHYQIVLHDEETGIKIEQIAQEQRVLPQRIIKEAMAAYVSLPVKPDLTLTVPQTWEEFADKVGCERNCLLKLVKEWTPQQRQKLSELLATHLQSSPEYLNEVIGWVNGNLLKAALSQLSFTVQKIGGSHNLIDDPEIEHIRCRFVSVEYPGTKHEQWIFADVNNKLYPGFGREEFAILTF